MKRLFFIVIFSPLWLLAQEEEEPKFTVKGYVKDMVNFNFAAADSVLIDNLIHHRLNLAWFPNEHFTAKVELRNRIFSGDLYRLVPNYDKLVDVNNDYFDLSAVPVKNSHYMLHTMIDRAYLTWNNNDWEITAGRQRLNWGMNLAWNPNDLFNSYSFFDFDYEERPGSDALRIRKYTGVASEMEWAVKAADDWNQFTSAFKYQFNRWDYDIQLIGGVMKEHAAFGAGWAGSLGGAGFKGELTYLDHLGNNRSEFLSSVSVDYLFPNALYINGSVLYNSFGQQNPVFQSVNSSSRLDIRYISPYRWSSFVQLSSQVHPLLNTGLAVMSFPADGSFFINPVITYSILSNLDLDIISQLYFKKSQNAESLFVRVKFSY